MKRLATALAGFAALGLLEWKTLSGEPIRIDGGPLGTIVASVRSLALAVLGVFAALTVLAAWKQRMREKLEERDRR